ncbi:tetratricopeptide repeat protein [Caenimonas koreensis]|nr:tetratricopeptide repeat protein [Caenimonas koreensis]
MLTDAFGNAVTLHDESALGGLNDFALGFLASEARAVNIIATAANDSSPLVQAYAAAVYMFAESPDGPKNAQPFLDRALAAAHSANDREQRFIHAVKAWVEGDIPRAIQLHEEQARLYPRDLVSLKLGDYHLFNIGDAPGMLRLLLGTTTAAGDICYLHGMLAFALEQCLMLEPAEAAARKAIAMQRREPWAHHALAHVMLTQGRIHEGHAFMQDVSDTWTGLNSFMVTHNWWHQALFALELDRHAEVLDLYDSQVWGVAKDYSQDQVNAVSLLARLEMAGVDVGDRWHDVANYLEARVNDHVLPFLDMQYLYALARADRPQADVLMRNIEAYARTAPAHMQAAWQRVCVPASRGLLAHARGDFTQAIEAMGAATPRLAEIGGSHAQRDLFMQVYVDSLVRGGQLAGAQHMLQQQARLSPESARLARQAASINTALGIAQAA